MNSLNQCIAADRIRLEDRLAEVIEAANAETDPIERTLLFLEIEQLRTQVNGASRP